MNISYSSSDYYSSHTCISIVSVLENNKSEDEINIFILDMGITNINKEKIRETVIRYGRNISFIQIDEEIIKEYLNDRIPPHIGSLATYARLCATAIYPQYIDRIMCIDSDMIITASLHNVYNSNLTGKLVAAVPIKKSRYKDAAGASYEERKIQERHSFYINAGFMIFELNNWRSMRFDLQLKKAANELEIFKHKDQTILNYALDNDYLFKLSPKYNFSGHRYPKYLLNHYIEDSAPFSKEEFIEAVKDPIVIHYIGDQSRPWFKENVSWLSHWYFKYKKLTPYKDIPIESLFDTPRFKNKSIFEKLFFKLYFWSCKHPIGYPIYFLRNKLPKYINR